jgi:hypothetical protein
LNLIERRNSDFGVFLVVTVFTYIDCCPGSGNFMIPAVFVAIGPNLFTSGRANPTGNPNFNTQKEVLVMRVVLTVGDERKEFITPG